MKMKIYQNATIFDAVRDMIGAIDNSDFSVEHIILVPDRFSLICEKSVNYSSIDVGKSIYKTKKM